VKRVWRYFFVVWIIFFVFAAAFMAQAQEDPSDTVEIVIHGKKYDSIKDYRREQIKNVLLKALSSHDLREFSEDELYDIIKEVRQQQGNDASSTDSQKSQTGQEDAHDLSASQMQEMLKEYLDEHKDAGPLFIDPEKVKDIIIGSQGPAVDTPKD